MHTSTPNLASPRHQVALKMLGILPEQLQPLDPKLDPETLGISAAALKRKVEVYEKKRKAMLNQLEEAVNSVTSKDLESSHQASNLSSKRPTSAPSTSSKSHGEKNSVNDPSIARMMAKEAGRLQKLQEAMKNDIARSLLNAMEAKEIEAEKARRAALVAQKHQEELKRLAELGKVKEAQAQKLLERRENAFLKAANEAKEQAAANAVKAAEKMDKIQAQKEKNAEARAVARQEKDAKTAIRKDHLVAKEDRAFANLLHELEVKAERDEAIEIRREEIRRHFQEQAEKREEKFQECRQRVEDNKIEAELKRHAFHAEHSERMNKANEVLDSLHNTRLKYFADKNKLRNNRMEKGLARTRSETADKQQRLNEKFFDKFGKTFEIDRRQRQEDFVRSLKERRVIGEESVQENRARLSRAQNFYEGQKLAQISNRIDKVNIMQETRRNIQTERTKALQKCWIEKNNLEHVFERIKYVNNPSALARIASEIGVDIDAIQRSKEGGEGQRSSLIGEEEQ